MTDRRQRRVVFNVVSKAIYDCIFFLSFDWSIELSPSPQPIRCKSYPSRDLVTLVSRCLVRALATVPVWFPKFWEVLFIFPSCIFVLSPRSWTTDWRESSRKRKICLVTFQFWKRKFHRLKMIETCCKTDWIRCWRKKMEWKMKWLC